MAYALYYQTVHHKMSVILISNINDIVKFSENIPGHSFEIDDDRSYFISEFQNLIMSEKMKEGQLEILEFQNNSSLIKRRSCIVSIFILQKRINSHTDFLKELQTKKKLVTFFYSGGLTIDSPEKIIFTDTEKISRSFFLRESTKISPINPYYSQILELANNPDVKHKKVKIHHAQNEYKKVYCLTKIDSPIDNYFSFISYFPQLDRENSNQDLLEEIESSL